jgi:hypothetical protein
MLAKDYGQGSTLKEIRTEQLYRKWTDAPRGLIGEASDQDTNSTGQRPDDSTIRTRDDQGDLLGRAAEGFLAFEFRVAALNLVSQVDDQQVKDAMVLHNSPPLYLLSQPRAKPAK